MKRDPLDRRGPERTVAGFVASVIIHALMALLLFSLASSTSEQSAPESFSGSAIVTVTRQVPQNTTPVTVPRNAAPIPHAPVARTRVAAQPRTAASHPRVLHELSKFAPTAPPNPTPQPVNSQAPNPQPTVAVIAVSPAPIEAVVPTSAPANIVAATIKVPPTAAPVPKPKVQVSGLPSRAPVATAAPKAIATPRPEPSALAATEAPLIANATPQAVSSPGSPVQVRLPHPAATPGHAAAATPGPKPAGSPGPSGAAPKKSTAVPRPLQPLPATPPPAAVTVKPPAKAKSGLNQRLQNLIPTAQPTVVPAPRKRYSFLNGLVPTPQPEPTPPPEVLAATQFTYTENVGSQRWKQSILGTAPEEKYVKMYVTSVKRIGPIKWCTGWVVRAPIAGSATWIVEPSESLICSGRLEPYSPSSPAPKSTP